MCSKILIRIIMNWKGRLEEKFEDATDLIIGHAKKIIFLMILLVVSLGSQLTELVLDTSTEGFLHKTDPMRIDYNNFRDEFGRDEKLLLAIETKNIFEKEFLVKLSKLQDRINAEVKYLDSVESIINTRIVRGTGYEIVIEELFEKRDFSKGNIEVKEKEIENNELIRGLLYSADKTMAMVVVGTQTYTSSDEGEEVGGFDEGEGGNNLYITDIENDEVVLGIQKIISDMSGENFKIHLTGSAVIAATLKQSMQADTEKFAVASIVMILFVLYGLFRRMSGVLLPFIAVIATTVSTISIMAIVNEPFTMVSQIMPSFLLAVITGGSIHLLTIFYREIDRGLGQNDAIKYAMKHSGLAIVMTSLTTAVGLFSFATSEVAPVAGLGLYAGIGVVGGLIYILILIPAILSIVNVKRQKITKGTKVVTKFLEWVHKVSTTKYKIIIWVSVVIVIGLIALASQLRFSHYPLEWFNENNPSRIATEIVDEKMRGSITMEIVLDTGKEGGIHNPKFLKNIEEATEYMIETKRGGYYTGKVMSVVDIIKEINQALHSGDKNYYKIPADEETIAQELFLFANSGESGLDGYINSDFSKARMIVKVPYIDSIEYAAIEGDIKKNLDDIFGKTANVKLTGLSIMLSGVMVKAIHSSAISYLLALFVISIMMVIMIGNLKIGLISMIPNILPILSLSAVMFLFNMPLDMFTLLIGAIALGLAVDDTVHFMHNFRRYQERGLSIDKSVRYTLLGTGRAIVVTSIVLSMGFLVLLMGEMNNMYNFGILTATAIIVAMVADFFLVPAIMKVIENEN
jgi:predicted RND superfamily exporter protein